MSWIAVLIPLLLSGLAGCVGTQDSTAGIDGAAFADSLRLEEFEAAYKWQNYQMVMRLGAPARILDADLVLVEAYPLEMQTYVGGAKEFHYVFWLSGDLRMIRHDDVCESPSCPFQSAVWLTRGAWAPRGLGANLRAERGMEIETSWGRERDIVEDYQRSEGQVTVNIGGPPGNPTPWFGYRTRYVYEDEDPVPERAQLWVPDGDIVRTFFVRGAPLPMLPPLREIGAAPTLRSGDWFPGSDQPIFGNVSTDDAVDALSAQSPDFRRAARDECITGFSLQAPSDSSALGFPGGLVGTERTTKFTVETYPPLATQQTNWRVEWQEHPIYGDSWVADGSSQNPVALPFQCETDAQTWPVAQDAKESLAWASSLAAFKGLATDGVDISLDDPYGAFASGRAVTFLIVFRPRDPPTVGLTFLPFAVEAASFGLWVQFSGDLSGMEGRFGLG